MTTPTTTPDSSEFLAAIRENHLPKFSRDAYPFAFGFIWSMLTDEQKANAVKVAQG